MDERVELGPGYVAWNQLKKQRDNAQNVVDSSNAIMKVIETDPSLDAAICASMGIRPHIPPQMQMAK